MDNQFQERKLCMIPGPVEIDERVSSVISKPVIPHVSPGFIEIFGDALRMMRTVVNANPRSSQPIIVAGSGTLGWDMVAANLLTKNERVLVLSTGLFGDRFAECLEVYGAKVDILSAKELGDAPTLPEIEEVLRKATTDRTDGENTGYQMVTITHVDTSTGVLVNVQQISQLVRRLAPEALMVVDGVCSVAAEELHMQEWDIDVVITASQKALGAAPGLSIAVVAERALLKLERISSASHGISRPNCYYADWNRWIPIMRAYEQGKGAYFGTPPVQLITALHASLHLLVGGKEHFNPAIIQKHVETSNRIRRQLSGWGLKLVPFNEALASHSMTAVYYPPGISASQLLPALVAEGVFVAAGLHPAFSDRYFRIGHMGISVTRPELGHIEKLLQALHRSLTSCNYTFGDR